VACLPVLAVAASAADGLLDAVTTETVRTPAGIRTIVHRVPAREDDLGMAIFPDVLVRETFAYTVRDRKGRDVMAYARVRFNTEAPARDVIAFYIKSLGAGVKRDTDKETGEVTLSAGDADDVRLVTVTPLAASCALRLERARHFAVAPRVYTPQETEALATLEAVAAAYRTAARVTYKVEQRTEHAAVVPPAPPEPPVQWLVDFVRPGQLVATATLQDVPLLRLLTKDGVLTVKRGQGAEDQRTLEAGALTPDLLPELRDDVVARLMLGDELASQAEEITRQPVDGGPATQVWLRLTFPDVEAELRLLLDTARQQVLRAEMQAVREGETTRIVRIYTLVARDAPHTPPPAGL
jgi:hypothetical protein